MSNTENNLNGANNSNTTQTPAERNTAKTIQEQFAEHQSMPEFFSLRLAFALQEAGIRFFETLSEKLNSIQDDLMLTPRFDDASEREDFMNIKWIIQELAEITEHYDESEINSMIRKETKILTNNYLRSKSCFQHEANETNQKNTTK